MKTGIHPTYQEAKVICACGNQFVTRSTSPLIKVEICNVCHPFFTGQQRLVDSAGRVERFGKRFAKTAGKTIVRQIKVQKKIGSPLLKVASKHVLRSTPTVKKEKKKIH
ncbi:MAG: 50S ribosomal protein L31 [Elusimicrobia bacterium]|nr:50S ribosomal protein L31 [Candidatus Obscuribacterium magneticum]